jgi:hypothetical protein
MQRRRFLTTALASATGAANAFAEDYPSKPIRVIAPFGPARRPIQWPACWGPNSAISPTKRW